MNLPSSKILWMVALLWSENQWTTCLALEEPNCPRYFYEQQILHAQVKLEHRLDLVEEKNKQFQDEVKQNAEECKETSSNLKSQMSGVQEEIKAKIEADINEMKQSVSDRQSDLDQKIRRLEQNINKAFVEMNKTLSDVKHSQGGPSTPIIAFKARGVSDKSPSASEKMVFQTIVVNVGDGYDSSTGYFTVPVNGLYMFTVQMGEYNNVWCQMHIVADDSVIGTISFRGYSGSTGASTSGNGLAVLSKGDKVWIKSYVSCSPRGIYEDSDDWCSFSGVLLNSGI